MHSYSLHCIYASIEETVNKFDDAVSAIPPLETSHVTPTLTDESQWHTAFEHQQELGKPAKVRSPLPDEFKPVEVGCPTLNDRKPKIPRSRLPVFVIHTSSSRLTSGLLRNDQWKPTININSNGSGDNFKQQKTKELRIIPYHRTIFYSKRRKKRLTDRREMGSWKTRKKRPRLRR